MNGWPKVRLVDVAPSRAARLHCAPGDNVWLLNLDQIESETGEVLSKQIVDVTSIGSSTCAFDEGNVLYSKLRPNLNKVVVPQEVGFCTSELLPLRPDPKRLDRDYLAHLLRSSSFVHWAVSRTDGAKMPRMKMDVFREYEISLPSLVEQRRLVARLDNAKSIRTMRRESIKLADDFLRSVFLDMFGDPVTNPHGWPIEPFGNLAENCDGQRVPVSSAERSGRKGKFPYYGASGIIDWVDDYLFDGPSLLIGEDGANLVARSTPIAFIATGKYWVNNHAHVLRENGNAKLEYLRFAINHRSLKDFVTGSAQPKLNQANLNRIPVALPPLSLQSKFVAIVQQQSSLTDRQRDAAAEADLLFQSLQQQAFA